MFRFRLVVWRLGSVAQRLGGLRFGLRVGSLGHRGRMGEMWFRFRILKWEFPEIRVPYLGVLLIRILLFRAPHSGPLFSETPICFWAEHLTLSFESLELPGPKASKPRAGFPLFLSRTRHTINTQTLTSYKHNKKNTFCCARYLGGLRVSGRRGLRMGAGSDPDFDIELVQGRSRPETQENNGDS